MGYFKRRKEYLGHLTTHLHLMPILGIRGATLHSAIWSHSVDRDKLTFILCNLSHKLITFQGWDGIVKSVGMLICLETWSEDFPRCHHVAYIISAED